MYAYGFKVGSYNKNHPLVIDPLLASTFIGDTNYDKGYSIEADRYGNVYVTGYTTSSDYPTTFGAYDRIYNGSSDVFISKLDSTLSFLLASTFVGGSGSEYPSDIDFGFSRTVLIVGKTQSSNFPTTTFAYDGIHNGDYDVFVSTFTEELDLNASTYIGGSGTDRGESIDADTFEGGRVYITGNTNSSNFPVHPSDFYDNTHNGGYDAFVTIFTHYGLSTLDSGTFLGGSSNDYGKAIIFDDFGGLSSFNFIPHPSFRFIPHFFWFNLRNSSCNYYTV